MNKESDLLSARANAAPKVDPRPAGGIHEVIAADVEARVPDRCKVHLRRAFAGDAGAAARLIYSLPNDSRGSVAVAMWRAKVPSSAFSRFLAEAWMHDHRHLLAATKQSRRTLTAMFRHASFARPSIGPTVRVWRGGTNVSLPKLARGHSWTTERDIACWFAMRYAAPDRLPIVIQADVPSESVAWFTDERNEAEALLLSSVRGSVVDADELGWAAAFHRVNQRIQRNNATTLRLAANVALSSSV